MCYPTHFLQENVLSNTFSVGKMIIQQILYTKLYYPANSLYKNLLSKPFPIRKCMISYFLIGNASSIQKCITQNISTTKMCFPKQFVYENVNVELCVREYIIIHHIFNTKIFYPLFFLRKCVAQYFFSSMKTCYPLQFQYGNRLSNILFIRKCVIQYILYTNQCYPTKYLN